MLTVISEFMDDLQLVSTALSVIVIIIHESSSTCEVLSEDSNFAYFFMCLEKWTDLQVVDMVLSIFHTLFAQCTECLFDFK